MEVFNTWFLPYKNWDIFAELGKIFCVAACNETIQAFSSPEFWQNGLSPRRLFLVLLINDKLMTHVQRILSLIYDFNQS